MATISYGKSVKPSAKSNASSRRLARRKAEAIQRELVASRIYKALGMKPEKQERLSRAEIACQRPVKPLLQYPAPANEYTQQIERNAEKLEREVQKQNRIYYRDANPFGNKIHAVQKSRGKSTPLI